MFNQKKNKVSMKEAPHKSPILNMISEGTKIKGSIISENDIRISGCVDGESICKGKIIITNSAKISGDLISVDADIYGNVDGSVKVSNKLILRQTANVGGDIHTKLLIVEEGALINGTFKMGAGDDVTNGLTDTVTSTSENKNSKVLKKAVSA